MVVFQIRPGWPEYRAKPIACSFTSSTGTGSDSPRYSTGSPTRRSVPVTYDGVMRASVLPAVPQAMNPFIFPSRGLVRSCHPRRSPATPRPVRKPSRGYDAGKKVNGRKRHVAVDTIGLLLSVLITAAGVQDRGGAKPLLWNLEPGTWNLRKAFPSVRLTWADGGYAGKFVTWAKSKLKPLRRLRPHDGQAQDAPCRSHGAALSDRSDRQGLRAAVERAGLVSRWLGVLLDLRPHNLPAWQVDGDGKDDPGAGYVVIMSFGAVGCAVVVHEGPGRHCARGCPAGPAQAFNQHAVVGTRQHDLCRLYARRRAVAVHLDASAGPRDRPGHESRS